MKMPRGHVRKRIESIVVVAALVALGGCGTSPTGPEQSGPADFDPAALFARLAGPYSLTFEADATCPVPDSLQTLSYDVVLQQTRFRYLGVRVPDKLFVGDLWALAREEEGFTLRWNVDCEAPDAVESTTFYLCGQGHATAADGTISGALVGGYRPFCSSGSHRFVLRRAT